MAFLNQISGRRKGVSEGEDFGLTRGLFLPNTVVRQKRKVSGGRYLPDSGGNQSFCWKVYFDKISLK